MERFISLMAGQGWVYTLRLDGGNWYVGWTQNLEQRICQHWLSRGADWTRIWKPLEVVAVSEGGLELEQAQTLAMMARHGWKRVRGGKLTSLALCAQPRVLGSVMSRGIPTREPTPAFLDEFVLVKGHVLRKF